MLNDFTAANAVVADYLKSMNDDAASRLQLCNHDITRGRISHCGSKYCLSCHRNEALTESNALKYRLAELQGQGAKLLFASATTMPCTTAEIGRQVDVLRDGWSNMLRLQHPHQDVKKPVGGFVIGGYRWLEVTLCESDPSQEWVHAHTALAMLPAYAGRNYLSKGGWNELWGRCGGGSLDVQNVRNVEAVAGYISAADKFIAAAELAINDPARHCARADALAGAHRYQASGELTTPRCLRRGHAPSSTIRIEA